MARGVRGSPRRMGRPLIRGVLGSSASDDVVVATVRARVGPEPRQPGIAERASYRVEVLQSALRDVRRFRPARIARTAGAARLLLGDPQIVEDVTQETLIRVYRSWSSIRVDAAIDSYAYRTLVRLVHRRRMRGFHRREVPTAVVPEQVVDEVDGEVDGDVDS